MSPSHAVKKGVRYRYYVSAVLIQGRKAEAGTVARVPAKEIETVVLDALRRRQTNELPEDPQEQRVSFEQTDLRVDLRDQALVISWAPLSDVWEGAAPLADADSDGQRMRIVVPYTVIPHKRRRDIILPTTKCNVRPIEQPEQESLTRAIAQSRAWLKEIIAGASIRTIVLHEKRSERMIRMTLTLAFLDPKLVRAALHGTLPRGVSMRRLVDAPVLWHDQWRSVGLSRPE